MKNAYVILVLLVCGLMGCKETTPQGPEDLLTVTKDKICLTYQKTEACVEGSNATYRLYLKDGKPVLESMQAEKAPGKPTYSQFNAAVALSSEKFTLTSDQRSIRLKDGERVYADSTGLGHLLMRDDKGKLWVMSGKNPKLDPRVYKWDPSRLTAAKPDRVTFESAKPLEMWMYLMAIHYQYGDAGNHYTPNDTGTEVVIIDNFHVVGSCDAPIPDDCCPSGEASGEQLNITEWVDDYAADGQTLLACFPVNSICTYTDGDKLIVIVCESQQRYCLDYSICNVSITTSDEGICFSVPAGCGMENPFD